MVVYATREDVKSALDYKETARADTRIDRALEAGSRSVDGLTHRQFAPASDTWYADWPDQYARPWRLWFDGGDVIELTEVFSNGAVIPADQWFLRRADGRNEPPYTYLELDLDSNAAFGGSTMQRAVRLTGLRGWSNRQAPAGTVVLPAGASDTTVALSSGAAVGVGSVLTVGAERLEVTGRSMADTGQTLTAALSAQQAATAVTVPDGSSIAPGEVLLVDAERMLVVDVAASTLVVRRAWDGSVLAAHDTGATVWASRRLTVARGSLGTLAGAIADGALVTVWEPPSGVRTLATAEAINILQQEQAGWARNTRATTGGQRSLQVGTQALDTLRQQVQTTYGRLGRTAAV